MVKRHINVSTASIDAAVTVNVLYSTSDDEKETLVRILGNIHVTQNSLVNQTVIVLLMHRRGGTNLLPADLSTLDESKARVADILRSWCLRFTDHTKENWLLDVDVKSKRKLREGDDIVLACDGANDNSGRATGIFNLFIVDT